MIEINLLPDSKQEYLKAQRARSYVISGAIFASIAAIGLVVILVLIMLGQTVTGKLVDDKITKLDTQLKGENDISKILTIQHQLSLLSSMHANKQITSRLFPLLEAINPPSPNNITITGVRVDTVAKTITIDGRAANMYTAAEVFKKTIVSTAIRYTDTDNQQQTDPLVPSADDVISSDIGVSEDPSGKKILRLTMQFTYPDSLFAESSTNAVIQSPSQSNATDSYLRVPQSLFSDGGGN